VPHLHKSLTLAVCLWTGISR